MVDFFLGGRWGERNMRSVGRTNYTWKEKVCFFFLPGSQLLLSLIVDTVLAGSPGVQGCVAAALQERKKKVGKIVSSVGTMRFVLCLFGAKHTVVPNHGFFARWKFWSRIKICMTKNAHILQYFMLLFERSKILERSHDFRYYGNAQFGARVHWF